MISQIRNCVFTKILWMLMGLYLLNISVDSGAPNPEHVHEGLSINDQESIIEIVVEEILGYENAIEERYDNNKEDHNKNKKTNDKTDITIQDTNHSSIKKSFSATAQQKFPDYNTFLRIGFQKLSTPPPKI